MGVTFVLRLCPAPLARLVDAALAPGAQVKVRAARRAAAPASGKPGGAPGKYDASGGRWVTIHGHPVYIRPKAGGHEAIRAGATQAPDVSPTSASPGNDAVRAWGHGRAALAFFQGGDPDLKGVVPSQKVFDADPAKATGHFYDEVSGQYEARGRALT